MGVIAKFAWPLANRKPFFEPVRAIARHPARAGNNSSGKKRGSMRNHSLMVAIISAVGLATMAPCSSCVTLAQEKVGQPVSVYVAALKGACMPDRPVSFVNG